MLWRRCCRGLLVWSRVLQGLGRLSPLRLSYTTCPDKAMGKTQIIFRSKTPVMSWNLLFCQLCFTLVFLLIFLTVYGVYAFADQYWCVLPVTLLWISWLRRLTRLDWRLSGCVPKVGRPLSRQCPSSLCITRLATWTGQWHVENSALDSNIIDTQLLSCTSGFTLF